jgi:anti-anti-sigma factor
MLKFENLVDGSVNVLSLSGRLDPSGGKDLREQIEKLLPEGGSGNLLVDLSSLEYMASAGFRELFLAGRKLGRRGSKLAVCGLTGEVKRVFELARFDTAYPIYNDRAEGISALEKAGNNTSSGR